MNDFALPERRYALSGDVNIAYQVMGMDRSTSSWSLDLSRILNSVMSCPAISFFAPSLELRPRGDVRQARPGIIGQGLSDRVSDAPSLEQRMDDVRAIMDAIGSQRATLFGHSEGCAMSALFAATYPERVSGLILFGGYVTRRDVTIAEVVEQRVKFWGTGAMLKRVAPSLATDRPRLPSSPSSNGFRLVRELSNPLQR
jgi:pimeloyl-ACP methyl ester carboxylesterase